MQECIWFNPLNLLIMTVHSWKCEFCGDVNIYTSKNPHPSLKHTCKTKELNKLVNFQLFLYEKGLITNHDWDFEKEAKTFLKIIKL